MNNRAGRPALLAIVLLAVCGWTLAQSASGPADQSMPAAPAAAPASDTVTPTGGKGHDNTYVIGADDLLSINVWKEPEFTQSIPVRSDGKISLPLIGDVQAAGRTPLQLEVDIAARLKMYITEPNVTVMVMKVNSQNYNILGRVAKPGTYPLVSGATVLDAIAAAGGFLDFAKQKGIYVLRQNPGGGETRMPFNYKDVIKGKHPGENVKLQARDTVVVP